MKYVDHPMIDCWSWMKFVYHAMIDYWSWGWYVYHAMIGYWSWGWYVDRIYDRGVDHVWCITKSSHHESYRDHYLLHTILYMQLLLMISNKFGCGFVILNDNVAAEVILVSMSVHPLARL